jgi:hypothetical protein
MDTWPTSDTSPPFPHLLQLRVQVPSRRLLAEMAAHEGAPVTKKALIEAASPGLTVALRR